MRIICFFVLGAFLLIMQSTLFPLLPSWLGRPDPLFLLVVFLAYRFDLFRGALLVFLLGLTMDIFSGVILGLYPIIYLLIFFLLKAAYRYLSINESVAQIPLAIVSYLLSCSAIFVVLYLLATDNPPEWSWGSVLLQTVLLTIISIPCFVVYEFVLELLAKKVFITRYFKPGGGNRFVS